NYKLYQFVNGLEVLIDEIDIENTILPEKNELLQNYPNPFNPSTIIEFNLKENLNTTLIVYNILGEKVTELFNGFLKAGNHKIEFNASHLSSGVYYYHLSCGEYSSYKKMLIIK
ncbi:MAG: T9SS type A sorting domain-containing protein, partial [Melioribacteraceae bacterium]|nr:T9SS type A sorting domain-containing protein [Melioribacteraceae bacterium]